MAPVHPDFRHSELLTATRRIDLDGAPDVSLFYGRTEELATLEQGIVQDKCRLAALWGMGGMGKTALSVKLAERIKGQFEYVIWRSLHNAPPLTDILANHLQFLTNKTSADLPENTEGRVFQLMEFLRVHRCLVILDGVDALLGTGQLSGKYRSGYQEYGKLFKQVGESHHHSCLLLASSEKSIEIVILESKTGPVRSLKLNGLSTDAARAILKEKGLVQEDEWDNLIKRYGGNPLALKIVGATILDLFNGSASKVLRENTTFIGQIVEVLAQQFKRLCALEIEVMCQLAIAPSPGELNQLREGISASVSKSELIEAVESLGRRSLIEQSPESGQILFALHPVVRKYVIQRLIQTERRVNQP